MVSILPCDDLEWITGRAALVALQTQTDNQTAKVKPSKNAGKQESESNLGGTDLAERTCSSTIRQHSKASCESAYMKYADGHVAPCVFDGGCSVSQKRYSCRGASSFCNLGMRELLHRRIDSSQQRARLAKCLLQLFTVTRLSWTVRKSPRCGSTKA